MPRLHDVFARIRALLRRHRQERALDDEVAFHLEMDRRHLIEQGWPPAAAGDEALRRFGHVAQHTRRARDSWGITAVIDAVADARVALRQLARRPAFTTLAVGTLALGMGAAVALSSVAVGLLVRPLPVADESRLQVFWSDFNWRGVEFDFVKERQRAFAGLAAYSNEGYTLRIGEQSSTVLATVSSAELFDVLGARPLLGRVFQPGDDRPGAAATTVVSYGFWQQELGGDSAVIGRLIDIGGEPVEVVGVMPRGFYFPSPVFRLWRPLMLDPASEQYQGNGWLVLVGRERVDLSTGARDADVQAIARALGERFDYPEAWDKSKGASVTSLRTYLRGTVRPAVLLLQVAVLIVLATACANVAALVVARTTDRAEELAMRAALGASRGRLIRQIVGESVVLSMLAGVAGAGVAVAGFQALVSRLPLTEGVEETLQVDWTLFAIASLLSVVLGLVVALAPVRALLRGRLQPPGRQRGAASSAGPRRTHAILVSVEVALAVVLVAGATLFARSVARLYAIDPGFDASHVAVMDVVAPSQQMPATVRAAFFDRLLTRVEAVPGIAAAGFVTRVPLRDGGWQGTVTIEDRPDLADDREPNALFRIVSPGYFTAMDIAVVSGRPFAATDGAAAPPVAIVSAAFAERMWPGRDPLGRRVRHRFDDDATWVTVVGVAEETRMTRLTGDNPNVLYVPMAQASTPESPVLVMKGRDADPPVAAVRAVVRELEPTVATARVATLEGIVASAVAEPLRLRFFLSWLGSLTLVIGAAGIYSVVSYSVTRRRAEFGVRKALGASPSRIVSDVLTSGLAPVAWGVVAGLGGTLVLGSAVRRFLYGVDTTDPASLVGAALVLLAVGLVATLVPGLSASRTEPVTALRNE